MKCQSCDEDMLTIERFEVQIDYCPACRGVWLDRGELDKIIELIVSQPAKKMKKHKGKSILPDPPHEGIPDNYRHEDDYYEHKKKSFLKELFKF